MSKSIICDTSTASVLALALALAFMEFVWQGSAIRLPRDQLTVADTAEYLLYIYWCRTSVLLLSL